MTATAHAEWSAQTELSNARVGHTVTTPDTAAVWLLLFLLLLRRFAAAGGCGAAENAAGRRCGGSVLINVDADTLIIGMVIMIVFCIRKKT